MVSCSKVQHGLIKRRNEIMDLQQRDYLMPVSVVVPKSYMLSYIYIYGKWYSGPRTLQYGLSEHLCIAIW